MAPELCGGSGSRRTSKKRKNAMDLSHARSIARIQASHRAVVNRLHHTQDAVSELKSRVETSVPRKNTSSRTVEDVTSCNRPVVTKKCGIHGCSQPWQGCSGCSQPCPQPCRLRLSPPAQPRYHHRKPRIGGTHSSHHSRNPSSYEMMARA